ncbi:MAG: hypothetical protein LAO30_01025 [Acidobacteriia bacterium]|nr:hypothetical protein [Terriglobia bacterium]
MSNDVLVKCPVCGVFTRIEKPELLAALNDPKICQQIENYVAGLLPSPPAELASVATSRAEVRNFDKDVHSWNPAVPMWQRSPKE